MLFAVSNCENIVEKLLFTFSSLTVHYVAFLHRAPKEGGRQTRKREKEQKGEESRAEGECQGECQGAGRAHSGLGSLGTRWKWNVERSQRLQSAF